MKGDRRTVSMGVAGEVVRNGTRRGFTRAASAAFAGVALLVAGCSAQSSEKADEYPVNVEVNFLNACEVQQAAPYCGCMFSHVKQQVAYHDFIAMEAAFVATGILPPELVGLAARCGGDVQAADAFAVPTPTVASRPVSEQVFPAGALPGEAWSQERYDFVSETMAEHFAIELSNVQVMQDIVDIEHVCVDVAATNQTGRETMPMTPFSAVRPSGSVAMQSIVTTLDSGSSWFDMVLPGATTTATKCFATGWRARHIHRSVRAEHGHTTLVAGGAWIGSR